MRSIKILALSAFALAMPHLVNAINYVNTEAPGVHLEVDKKTGEKVWRDGMGNFLSYEKEAKPIQDMDKFYIYENKWVEKGSAFAPHKEWDSKRNCFVWKSVDGDFLGRDISSITDDDLKWLSESDEAWWDDVTIPDGMEDLIMSMVWEYQEKVMEAKAKQDEEALKKLKEKELAELNAQKKQQEKDTESKLRQTDQQMQVTDEEMRQAQRELQKARAELRALGMTEYEGLLNDAEASIKQAQDASSQYKQKRRK